MTTGIAGATETAADAGRRRIATNFVTLALTSLLGLLVTILISVYVRRILGPVAVGQASWALAAIGYLTVAVCPALTIVAQRELARMPKLTPQRLALVLTLQTMLAVAVYGALLVLAAFEPRGKVVSVLLVIYGVTLFSFAWNTGWVLQAHERMVAPSIAGLVINALQLPALALLVYGPGDLYLYAALSLPFAFAGVLFNLWYIARRGLARLWQLRPTLSGTGGLFREAWPLALAQGAAMIAMHSGTIILGFTHGDAPVGQFTTAYRLMLVAAVITAALWNAYFPAFARTLERRDEAIALSREYLALLAWMGLPMAALGWALGRHVVGLLYGPQFGPSGHYFEWLCITIGLTFLNYGVVATLVPWGYGGLQLKIAGTAAILNLCVCALAIPLYGPWGAVAATISSELLVVIVGLLARRRLRLHWHPVLPVVGPPLVCSAAVAMILVSLPGWLDRLWWLQLLIGAAVLAGCFAAFEQRALRRLLRSFA
ncbi:MAG: oligosaccharide flippase family protein [Alphaproteobacteria bacterium]|nr:oligosaccharide flippase family protein [Alphaproteobacteria bacterium]MCW5743712.1 oligosaccharide flippase family protein [Alphaproteobacteria bacterium]